MATASASVADVLDLRTRRISLSFIMIMGVVLLALIPIFLLVVVNRPAAYGAIFAAAVTAISLLLVYRGLRRVGNAIFFAVCLLIPIGVGAASLGDPASLPAVMISVVALELIILIPTGVLISPFYTAVATLLSGVGVVAIILVSGVPEITGRVPLFSVLFVFAGAVIFFFSRIQNQLMNETVTAEERDHETVEQLRELVSKVEDLRGESNSGSEFMTKSLEEIKEIIASYSEQVETVSTQSGRLSTEVAESRGKLSALSAALGGIITKIGEQGSVVDRNAERQREMATSLASVRDEVNQAEARNNELEETSQRGRQGIDQILESIRSVESYQTQLQEINDVMSRIAAQTNILAMNASIEAAHAGEAGRGFAVVANEVRNLSDHANSRTKEIGGIIKEMNGAISRAGQIGTETGEALISITEGVAASAPMVRNLRSSIDRYVAGIEAMVEDTENLVSLTKEIGEGADGQGDRLQEYDRTFSQVLQATEDIARSVEALHEYNAKTERIVSNLTEVRENQDAINRRIDELMQTARADAPDQA